MPKRFEFDDDNRFTFDDDFYTNSEELDYHDDKDSFRSNHEVLNKKTVYKITEKEFSLLFYI